MLNLQLTFLEIVNQADSLLFLHDSISQVLITSGFHCKWFKLSAVISYPPQNIHTICPIVDIHLINF